MNPDDEPITFTNLLEDPLPEEPEPELIDDPVPEPLFGEIPLDIEP